MAILIALEVLDQAEGDGSAAVSGDDVARTLHLLAESYGGRITLAALSTRDLQTPRVIAIRCELAFQECDWQQLTELLPVAEEVNISAITLAGWEERACPAFISEGKESATTAWKRA